jgi:hypothetical protein
MRRKQTAHPELRSIAALRRLAFRLAASGAIDRSAPFQGILMLALKQSMG